MVDVGSKAVTERTAHARGSVRLPTKFLRELMNDDGEIVSPKGPVLATACVAGTMAVKSTSTLIPFCHPMLIESCKIAFTSEDENGDAVATSSAEGSRLVVDCRVKVTHKTGAEMEALTGCSVASLTIYDMLKAAVSHSDMSIGETRLIRKTGGKSDFQAAQ